MRPALSSGIAEKCGRNYDLCGETGMEKPNGCCPNLCEYLGIQSQHRAAKATTLGIEWGYITLYNIYIIRYNTQQYYQYISIYNMI